MPLIQNHIYKVSNFNLIKKKPGKNGILINKYQVKTKKIKIQLTQLLIMLLYFINNIYYFKKKILINNF
jgi:hypothetical protein